MKNRGTILGVLLICGIVLISGCGTRCADECTEWKCNGTVYYDCVEQEDGCYNLINKGEVEGKCGYKKICDEGDTKCEETTYFECYGNQWQNMGQIEGKCRYSKCPKPYINVGGECCLDKDDNGICDKDEEPECGDRKCDSGETQDTCCTDCGCHSGKKCENNECITVNVTPSTEQPEICGDGNCGTGESKDTCCIDCGCPSGKVCTNNKCENAELGEEPKITIELDERTASGKVSGVNPSEYGNYWVVVYVETDMLYIQPLVIPSSARYIEIESDGYWSVSALNIDYGGKVRAFLIRRGTTVPDTLPIGKKPNGVVAEAVNSIR